VQADDVKFKDEPEGIGVDSTEHIPHLRTWVCSELTQTRSSFENSLVDTGFVLEHRNSSEFIFACSSESGVARNHFICKHIFVTHCSLCSTICNW
jgi:hypothetical protein